MTKNAIEAAANAMLALERENARPSHLDYARVAVAAAYPSLVAEIARLNAARLADSQRMVSMSDEYEAAQDEIERLHGLLKECADELAAQVEGQYAKTKDHPAMKRRYDRDMAPVLAARAALEGKSDD